MHSVIIPTAMRVATFNVRHGRPRKGFASNRRLAAACARLDADIIGLQELERGVVRSWFADQLRIIASATGTKAVYAPARRLGLTGTGGVGLCVRGTVLRTEVLCLPHNPGEYQRVALFARVDIESREASVAVTHLGGTKHRAALVQLQALLDAYSNWSRPRILLGDLNMDPWEVRSQLSHAGFNLADDGQPSFPVLSPSRRIDHVATDGLEVERVDVRSMEVSDHRAVVATVK